jgi:hypothetical protein
VHSGVPYFLMILKAQFQFRVSYSSMNVLSSAVCHLSTRRLCVFLCVSSFELLLCMHCVSKFEICVMTCSWNISSLVATDGISRVDSFGH